MNKTYCVHVYPRPYIYEGVEAKSPEEAVERIIERQFGGDHSDIQEVEVMISCHCGLDNDTSNAVCDDCGAKL